MEKVIITDEQVGKITDAYRYNYEEECDDDNRAFADGIRYTLNTLGIKIEGVNA